MQITEQSAKAYVADYFAKAEYETPVTCDILYTEPCADTVDESENHKAISKIGVCVIVITPTASGVEKNTPRPYFEKISTVCRVVELPTVNRGGTGLGITAYDFAEMCAITLHQWSPFMQGSSTVVDVNTTLTLDNPSIVVVPDSKFLIIDVRFVTALGIDSTLFLAPPSPVVSNNNPTIRFSNLGVLQIYDSGTAAWLDIGLQNGQLFLSAPTDTDVQNIRFVGGSMQLNDDVADVWMTVGAENGQLFADPTNSPAIANIQFVGGNLQIKDSATAQWWNLGVQNGQLFLS